MKWGYQGDPQHPHPAPQCTEGAGGRAYVEGMGRPGIWGDEVALKALCDSLELGPPPSCPHPQGTVGRGRGGRRLWWRMRG